VKNSLASEPVLVTSVISAALSLIVTLNVGLTSDQAGAITAAITAVFAAIAAAVTRPVVPTAFTGLVTVVADLLATFHFHVDPSVVGSVNGLVLALLMLITRGHVSPVARPLAAPTSTVAQLPTP
jgi:hypothetical protein